MLFADVAQPSLTGGQGEGKAEGERAWEAGGLDGGLDGGLLDAVLRAEGFAAAAGERRARDWWCEGEEGREEDGGDCRAAPVHATTASSVSCPLPGR